MSNNVGETPRIPPPPPQRPRHQITRSISELSSPIRLHRRNSLHAERRRSRRRGKDSERGERLLAPHSAAPSLHPQSRTSMEFSRSEGVTPNWSPDTSRRTSILMASGDDAAATVPPSIMPSAAPSLVRLPKEEETQTQAALHQISTREKKGLDQALINLADLSHTTSHTLDQAYYSMMIRLGMLQSAVSALGELARGSHELNAGFERDARLFERDAHAQLDALGRFDAQQARIQALQARVSGGHDRMRALDARVDAVCRRVEAWEAADRAWQERTRRRLRTLWVVTSVLVLLFVLLAVSVQYASGNSSGGTGGTDSTGGLGEWQREVGNRASESAGSLRNIATAGAVDGLWSLARGGDDGPLRRLEEL